MHDRKAFLGQVPLILGPGSWGVGIPMATFAAPPFYGQWGVLNGPSGRVGPFDTIEQAFQAAVDAAVSNGATELPTNGFAQVVDSRGNAVGPVT